MHPQVFLAARQLGLGAVEALQRGCGFVEFVLRLPIMICRCRRRLGNLPAVSSQSDKALRIGTGPSAVGAINSPDCN